MKTPIPPGAKICFTADDKGFDSEIHPHFRRAPYYLILEPMARQLEVVRNPHMEEAQGGEVRSARMLVDKGVRIILTGQIGSQAGQVLHSAGVKVIADTSGTVRDAIRDLAEGVK